MSAPETKKAVYFSDISLEGIACFKGRQTLLLTEKEGGPARVTVILGDNGTGKTTLLKGVIACEPKPVSIPFQKEGTKAEPIGVMHGKNEYLLNWRGNWFGGYLSKEGDGFRKSRIATFGSKNTGYIPDEKDKDLLNLTLFSYGASRKLGFGVQLTDSNPKESDELFLANEPLPNAEEWYIKMDYGVKKGVSTAQRVLDRIHQILTSILPDVSDVEPKSIMVSETEVNNYLNCKTPYGWVPLRELSFGYQTMFAWVVDLARRMFQAYPKSSNPLEEPAVVLVDEIDLHLHPHWQRKVIKEVTQHFPKTQFIFTSHSPLVVQSVDKLNLAILRRDGDHVTIENRQDVSYIGWTVEEILEDLMGVDEPYSDIYLKHVQDFEKGLSAGDFKKVQAAYEALKEILHPSNELRDILEIQMAGLREEMKP